MEFLKQKQQKQFEKLQINSQIEDPECTFEPKVTKLDPRMFSNTNLPRLDEQTEEAEDDEYPHSARRRYHTENYDIKETTEENIPTES